MNQPAGTARGGSAIIKNSIKYHQVKISFKQLVCRWKTKSSAVYHPPKYTVKQEQLEDFYNSLGCQFIAGGDYNVKHTDWGSRLITPRGREVLKTMEINNLKHISMGEPAYWTSDRN
jgi:hypothetical protein